MHVDFFESLTSAEKLQWRQQDMDAQIKRREIRAGIWKVALGTCIVGVAAALFPAVQSWSQNYFEFVSEQKRINIQSTRSDQVRKLENRQFLESLAGEGRSASLDKRIILAEYYVHLSEDEDEKIRWEEFYSYLVKLRQEQRQAVIAAAEAKANPESNPVEVARTAANAQLLSESADVSQRAGPAVSLPPTFLDLLDRLSAEDSGTRRRARSELAGLGVPLVKPALAQLKTGPDYRERLGLTVALTEMMRDNKSQRTSIIELLSDGDLETLLIAATDDDRTLRIHAGEFLFDLGDPRLFAIVPDLWERTSSDNGRFNLALALQGASPHVPAAEHAAARAVLEGYLGDVGPQTDALLQRGLNMLGS